MNWKTIERPGPFGDKKSQILKEYDLNYGKNNWRIVHKYNDLFLSFIQTCKVFEEAYFQDSFRRPGLWKELRQNARDVYDISESDIKSGLDYSIQNNVATHIQDIAIRNVFARRKWVFVGEEYFQIRSNSKPFGFELTPGKVLFHEPWTIVNPSIKGWWDKNSVEDFYQSNKYLQIIE